MTLTEFLLARIAEDEAAVESLGASSVAAPVLGLYSPARVLAECEAKRRLVDIARNIFRDPEPTEPAEYLSYDQGDALDILKALALPYADHPDYQQEWKVAE